MNRALVCIVSLAFLAITAPAARAQVVPEVGWWWNPNESGRGYFIESAGGITYLAGYFYESDGRATWLIAGGPNADPAVFEGRLQSFSQGQTLLGDYKQPTPAVDAGPVTVRFTDDRTGTITWPGGTIPIERMNFGTGPADFQPLTGLWWNAAESGTGYNLEVQGDTLFVNAFVYDEAGSPVWYLSAGKMTSPTTYEGPWLRFSGGQTMTGSYRAPAAPVEVARLGIAFLGDDEADFTFVAVGPPTALHAKAGIERRTRANPTFARSRPFPFPKRYEGPFRFDFHHATGPATDTVATVSTARLVLVEESTLDDALGCLPTKPGQSCRVYVPQTQNVRLQVFVEQPFVGGGTCTGILEKDFTIGPNDLRLVVSSNRKYAGEFTFKSIAWTALGECRSTLPPYIFPMPLTGHFIDGDYPIVSGVVVRQKLDASFGPITVNLGRRSSAKWTLSPVF